MVHFNWQVGLKGEGMKVFSEEGSLKAKWMPLAPVPRPLTWYRVRNITHLISYYFIYETVSKAFYFFYLFNNIMHWFHRLDLPPQREQVQLP